MKVSKTVNTWFVDDILMPLSGGADDDTLVRKFVNHNPNDETSTKAIISEYFVTPFNEKPEKWREKAKTAFKYILTRTKEPSYSLERFFNAGLLPFDPPDDPNIFFFWLWEELFPGEDYFLEDIKTYKEVNQVWESSIVLDQEKNRSDSDK